MKYFGSLFRNMLGWSLEGRKGKEMKGGKKGKIKGRKNKNKQRKIQKKKEKQGLFGMQP